MKDFEDITVAVAGTGYVGLSIATLLSQYHHVTAVDVIPEKVEKLNNKISPIQDVFIEKYLAEKPLNLVATLDDKTAKRCASGLCWYDSARRGLRILASYFIAYWFADFGEWY